jgi:hypothetical protein
MAKNKKDNSKRSKQKFEVLEGETVDQCLDRMKKEGYTPVRRVEQPIFKEVIENGETRYEPVSRKTIFDAILVKNER